jgi:simple sugar transport system ATP-binding protein
MAEKRPILELVDISKNFAGVKAIQDISLTINSGEVLCLLGDNGAGKSTLIKLISGFFAPSSGKILIDGAAVTFAGPRDARRQGIASVQQDFGAIPLMSVGRNFFLGAEPTRGWGPFKEIDIDAANRIAVEAIRRIGVTRVKDGGQLVGTMSGGERQALSIARAIHFGARVLILDEPTSALGVKEAAEVLRLMTRVRDEGVAIVFITHNAGHALAVGDAFAVLNQGRLAASFRRGERTREQLLNLMAGGEMLADLAAFHGD